MSVWMIAESWQGGDYPSTPDIDDVNVEHGYFLTKEDAQKKVDSLMEPANTTYPQYVARVEEDNKNRDLDYARRVEDWQILKDAGRNPVTPNLPWVEKVEPFSQWASTLYALFEIPQGSLDSNERLC